jgi:hypothetical protein
VTEENGQNNRRFVRTRLRASVKLRHPELGDIVTHTRDISDGGAYVVHRDGQTLPALGEVVEVQVQDLGGGDAPVVPMRVVRADAHGIGLEFLHGDDDVH